MKRALASLGIAALACGCASTARPEAPAVIASPTQASRAELLEVVQNALGRKDVTLADDALTRTNVLLIERAFARDPTGQRLSGRESEKPEDFRLVEADGRCTLIHQRTNRRYALTQARCAPMAD